VKVISHHSRIVVSHGYQLGLVLGGGLMLRLLMAWSASDTLIQKTLPDDAFYYFVIARNVWLGNGVSVDGVTLTNGFHPLWALALLLPFAAHQCGDLPLHLSLTLAALFDVGAAWLAYLTVRHVTGSILGGILATAFYAFNPMVAMESLNGLETALGVFCFALTTFVYLTRINGRKSVAVGDWALFGLFIGLMLLARTDSVLYAFVLGLHALWRGRRARLRTVAGLTLAAVVAALLLAPWLIWNLLSFGTIVQSSAIAAPSVFRRALFEPLASGAPFALVWWNGFWPVVNLSLLLTFRYAGLPWVALLVAVILKRVLSQPGSESVAGKNQEESSETELLLPLIGAVLPLLIHTFIRWYPRSWYYVPLAWASVLVVGPTLARTGRHLNTRYSGQMLTRVGLAALVVVLVLHGARSWRGGFYPWQSHMLAGARWIASQAPADAVVASFNSGLQAYYGNRPIVNLDGVIDWGAIRAGESRSLLGYARQRGATHLLDYEAYLFTQFAPYLEPGFADCLMPVATLSYAYPPYGRVVAYHIDANCPLDQTQE